MSKLLTSTLLLAVACVTAPALAQTVRGNATDGARKTQACMGCHGIEGYQASFPEVYKVPRIAGQGLDYIVAALTAYKKGDRKHPTMRAMADSLSEQDIADLAAYYSQLGLREGDAPPAPAATPTPDARVQALITRDAQNTCTSCHGANFNAPKDATIPKLAGQHADYLAAALRAYRTHANALIGRNNALMQPQAARLNDTEIKLLVAYVSALPGDVKTVPESRLHHAP